MSSFFQNLALALCRHNFATYSRGKKYTYPQNISPAHCSKLEIVLNENDIPKNQQFLLEYTLVLPKESRLQKSVDIQG